MDQIIVDSSPYQEQTFSYAGYSLRMTIRYNSIGDFWNFDLFDLNADSFICQSTALVVGIPMLSKETCSFYLWLEDESGLDLDPVGGEDLGTRCKLYIGEKDVTKAIWA